MRYIKLYVKVFKLSYASYFHVQYVFFILSTDQKEIVIGLTKILTTTIELSNHDEVAYNPELTITHDPSLQYERIAVDDVSGENIFRFTLWNEGYSL